MRFKFLDRFQSKKNLSFFEPTESLASLMGSKRSAMTIDDVESPSVGGGDTSWKGITFKLAIGLVIGFFGFRLLTLQVTEGQEHYKLAEGNRLQTVYHPAARGLIFDRNGIPLVSNVPTFTVNLQPSNLPSNSQDRVAIIESIATAVNRPPDELESLVRRSPNIDSITLAEGVDRDEALRLQLRLSNVSAIEIIAVPTRRYLPIPSLGHLVGYVGKVGEEELRRRPNLLKTAIVGKVGLERVYDQYLQGRVGIETFEVDSRGRVIRSVGRTEPIAGRSLYLGLDSRLQTQTAESLRSAMEASQAKSGAAVVMDVRTGEVVAMVSLPDFDPNIFIDPRRNQELMSALNDPGSVLLNRATSGQYPSGSTIKPLVAAAALEGGTIRPETRLDTSAGRIVIGQWTFVDNRVRGITDVRESIAVSNNIFFYALGGGYRNIEGLGAERLANFLKQFGLGERTGIDLTDEALGLVPTPNWKREAKQEAWFVGDTYNMSIGQGDLLLTPLQLTRAVAAIANGGRLLQPRLMRQITSARDSEKIVGESVATRQGFISGNHLNTVREGMRQTVTNGSARAFRNLPVPVAAKTGTAQFDLIKERTHSWFTAYAPAYNPEIAISVIVEGGGHGYAVAAPVARNIIERFFNLPITVIFPQDLELE